MAQRIRLNDLGAAPSLGIKPPAMPGSVPVHMASRIPGATGMHSYLGHFAQGNFLKAGHNTIHTGTFHGKSNKLGHGGRAAQLRAQGVPGGVIGAIARRKHAAPGQKNYHG